jgi:hypothetical protein
MAGEAGSQEYGPLTRNWSFELTQLKAFEALVRADERAEMRKGFAGVTLWIDSAYVTQIVTELEIQHERVPGTALKHAAEKCLAVYAGAREAK